ncbi:hypothetical protein FJY93_04875 [Candidatus Kaiserbacteria bacterium]|nr:hypothetical protein [Candidatus Kaiserbacteria bacterium]
MPGTVLSSSIFTPRYAGQSTIAELVAYRLKTDLSSRHPGWEYRFLGNPFGTLLNRLLIEREIQADFAPAELLQGWSSMYSFVLSTLGPLLHEAKADSKRTIVLFDGFGLDNLVHATSLAIPSGDYMISQEISDEVIKKTTELHHMLVDKLFKQEGVKPPLYYRLFAKPEQIDAWMIKDRPEIGRLSEDCRRRFIKHQEKIADSYFLAETGQTSYDIEANARRLEEIADEIFEHICSRIVEYERSLALTCA